MRRVHFAFVQSAPLRSYEGAFLPLVRDELAAHSSPSRYTLEDDPARADLIILLQSAHYKTVDYIRILESDPVIRHHAERVYVIDYDDHPEGALAGLYTSIERPFFNPGLHRSWPMLFMNNPLVHEMAPETLFEHVPRRLFSFVGAPSHSVRTRLFQHYASESPEYFVTELGKWYNHDDNDRRRFISVLLDSLFGLCPRGYAAYTNRICEVMALARVPVIIADDWIPFAFSDPLPYYIQVAEKDVEHLPEILRERRGDAEDLRRNARTLWERNCATPTRVVAAVDRIAALAEEAPRTTFQEYRAIWHSEAFLKNAGWTLGQRTALRIEQRVRRWFPSVRVPGVSDLMRYRNAKASQ